VIIRLRREKLWCVWGIEHQRRLDPEIHKHKATFT
jgi:hypothetical protein